MDQKAPRTAGPGLRVVTGIIAALALLATITVGGIALLGFVFGAMLTPSGDRYSGAVMAFQLVMIAIPLLCLTTTVVAIIATVSGRMWAVIVSSLMFVAMIVGTVLLNLWIGAVG